MYEESPQNQKRRRDRCMLLGYSLCIYEFSIAACRSELSGVL